LLRAARETDADLVGIIMTGAGSIATAVEAMKVGAFDYILKPFKVSVILPALSRALAMRRLRMENTKLERRLREHAADLEAANKDLEAFSYSVSHDLRSPLRAIDGYSAMLEEELGDKLDEAGRRLLNVVRDSSRKMGMLIDDLLAFSKLGRQRLSARHVEMISIVNEVWAEIRTSCPEGVPELRLPTLPDVWGDRALLKQVWTNLLSNAVKYSSKRDNPIIEVSADRHGTEVVYCVKDNGAGFDMRYADKLFEVFKRLHAEHEFPGTGAGLAIVYRIVARHGGRVWAEGKEGVGASFYFSLPLEEKVKEEEPS
jgi:light-regulated signal transduction histidine kinase (bacteriophytochrome)